MNNALWAAGLGGAAVVLVMLYAVARQGYVRWRDRRLSAQSARVRTLLAQARAKEFEGLDKMLFDMRDAYDPDLVEGELREELRGSLQVSPKLVHAFGVLGITDRYLAAVRGSPSWQQRALAATTLGALGELRAVKPLIEALHDTREDNDVKLAAAEALGQIKDPAAIPLLISELGHVDEWSSPRLAAVLYEFGELAVEPLMTALTSSSNLNVRVWAVQALGKIGDRKTVPALLARIHDRSDALRMSVTNALGELRDSRALHPLIDVILRDPSATVRAQAAAALGRIGDPACLPLLVASLGDIEYWVRMRALEAIEAMAPSDTSAIEIALADSSRDVRHRAALALDRLGALEQAFTDLESSDEAKWTAAEARLIAVGRAGLSERLTRHLDDPDARVRARVVAVLAALREPAHGDSLIKRLGDTDASVRLAAIDSLARLGGQGGTGPAGAAAATRARALLGVVEKGSAEERDAATAALLCYEPGELAAIEAELGKLGGNDRDELRAAAVKVLAIVPGEAVDTQLSVLVRDRFAAVRLTAIRALGLRNVAGATDDIGESLVAGAAELQVAAAEALGLIGGPRAIELLVKAMPAARDAFRDAVCSSLAGFGWEAAYPTFDVLLASDELGARIGVVWTLGKTGDSRAVPILRMLLHEPEGKVRSAAAGALGKIAGPVAVEALVEALGDPSSFVRAATVNALGLAKHVDPAAVAPLLDDPDAFVRNRAAFALGQVGGAQADELLGRVTAGIAPATIAIARGLTGTETGVAAALGSMQDAALRRELERALADESSALRRHFLANLGVEGSAPAGLDVAAIVGRYVETLRNSSDVEARRAAARALGGLTDELSIHALALAVRHDPDREVRLAAATRLAGNTGPAARSALLAAVHDPDPRVRVAAIHALGHDLGQSDVQPLFEALAGPDPTVVRAAEQALIAIHAASDVLHGVHDWMMAQESDALVRAGLRILAGIADSRSLRVVQALVRSASAETRIEAVRTLAALRIPDAIRTLLGALDDPTAPVRVAIVHALRGTTRADVNERLAAIAADPSPDVRVAVCETLGTLESNLAAPLLKQLAADRDVDVSVTAVVGLISIADLEGLAAALAAWPALSGEAKRRLQTAVAGHVPRLEGMVATALDATARELAVRTLAAIDATAHAERIARALRDPDGRVRLAAVRALVPLGVERIGEQLAALRDDPVSEIRMAVRRGPLKVV